MKARCPTQCGRDVDTANRVTGAAITSAWTVFRESFKPNLQQAALRKHRLAKERAVLWLVDRRKVTA